MAQGPLGVEPDGADPAKVRAGIDSVILVLGAVLGVGLGLVFGVALQRSQADSGIEVLSVPGVQLVIFVALAALIGVLAAVWPARRAARLDVLQALTTD